jgi:murein DD-endopeptidase MepM/ murein hydrolase activator NlpD
LKRALKKRVKAVLKNTPNSDGVPVVQLNEINHKPNRRAGTKAAMIGLAISMGATSLLVTRQSDQAQAAAPVGSQKAASTIPAVSDTEVKFTATKLESQAVSSASVPENPVILEPTAVSQVPGLEAKWPVAAKEKAVQISVPEANKSSAYVQPQVTQGLNNNSVLSTLQADKYLPETSQQSAPSQSVAESQSTEAASAVSNDVDAQLKAQQEFALNRLQQKSNRLRNSLAELRSEETQNLSQTGIETAQPTTVADTTLAAQSDNLTDARQTSLISKLKQEKSTTELAQKVTKTAPIAPKIVAQSSLKTYQVKPGDTLAEIASNYGTSVSELVKANNLQDPNQLQISQQLIIPVAGAGRSNFNQATLPTSPTFIPSGSSSTVANYPVSQPSLEANLPQTSQTLIAGNNTSAAISIPVVQENQLQVNTPTTTSRFTIPVPVAEDNRIQNPGTDPTKAVYGVGGDAPLPTSTAQIQTSAKQPQKVARGKRNERLRSLQAEIERLREKYRVQQSGVVIPTVNEDVSAGIPIPIQNDNEFKAANGNSQLSAVSIPVPKPILPSYNERAVQPPRTARITNEPINPEFLPNQTAWAGNSSRSSSGIRLTVPPAGVTATDSLGKLRGTRVSPGLPPLAAVDLYLPKAVDQNTNIPSTSSASYIWPAKGVLTSGYGWRWGKMHRGLDIANSTGTPIYASAPGVVEKAGWNSGGYGNVVDIRHADGSLTRYGHNSRILVQAGQKVEQGQTIAAMGSTGFSTGPHSHFEVHPSGKGAVNPIAFLPQRL